MNPGLIRHSWRSARLQGRWRSGTRSMRPGVAAASAGCRPGSGSQDQPVAGWFAALALKGGSRAFNASCAFIRHTQEWRRMNQAILLTALILTVRVDTEDGLPLFNLFGRASVPEFVIFKTGIAACHPMLHTPDSIRDYCAKGVPLFNTGTMRVLLQASDDG